MTEKESCQEAGRCLRCDHFGCGSFKGGRNNRMVNVTINGISLQVEEGTSILDATT